MSSFDCSVSAWATAFFALCGMVVSAAEDVEAEEAALMAELDALLRDPVEPDAEWMEVSPTWLWHTSVTPGFRLGYTTNALLADDALAMPYMKLRTDVSLLAFAETRNLTFLVSGETRRFLGEISLEEERILFLLARLEGEAARMDYGLETGALYAKQAYDAATSPIPREPDAGFVTQTSPFARAWVRHYPFPRSALEWSVRGERAWFGDSADDFTSGSAEIRFSYRFAPGVLVHATGERVEIDYDRRARRLPNGLPLLGTRLRLETWRAGLEVDVRPRNEGFPIRANVRVFAENRDDGDRGYHARTTRGIEGRASVRRGVWLAALQARHEESPYAARLVSLFSEETVTQRRRSGSLLLERAIGAWRISARAQRTEFLSKAAFESYTVNEFELGADLSF